ncbi:testis-expressed protein 30-like [Sycon ciliatum]|uniref:testis-expressed protein 30-like n=1 Tax=Sycon ciliatum TaxID=27933 RepID=UPI0031F6A4FA
MPKSPKPSAAAAAEDDAPVFPVDEQKTIDIGNEKTVRAVLVSPICKKNTSKTGVILTHGAGGDLDEEQITLLSMEFARQGMYSVRFTYKAPLVDKRAEIYRKVLEWFLQQDCGVEKIIVGGRSMGARVVLELASAEDLKEKIAGAICLSYPLHKDASCTDLRTTAFPTVASPVLFASGTKDPMCHQTVMKKAIKAIPTKVEMVWIEGANHSGMPKRKRQEAFEVPNYFHTVVVWGCDLAQRAFEPDLATNNDPGKKPVAAILAKRRRDFGDDPEAKRQFEATRAVLCRQ